MDHSASLVRSHQWNTGSVDPSISWDWPEYVKCAKARDLIGFEPRRSLDDIIDSVIAERRHQAA